MASFEKTWDVAHTYDTSETKDILGINFRDTNDTLLEMAECLIETGYIPDKRSWKISNIILFKQLLKK